MAQRVVNAGIDVSKQWLDVALWPTRETIRVSRDGGGLRELASWFTRHQVERIGIEASGGYEREVIDTLQAAGFEIALLNPLRVRRFAQAKGRLAKNDRADICAMLGDDQGRRLGQIEHLPRDMTGCRRRGQRFTARNARLWIMVDGGITGFCPAKGRARMALLTAGLLA